VHRDDNVAVGWPVGSQPGRHGPCDDGVHAFRRADQMPPVRWSQFVGHLLAIIDEARPGWPRGPRPSTSPPTWPAVGDDDDDARMLRMLRIEATS